MKFRIMIAALIFIGVCSGRLNAVEPIQLAGAVHVHSTVGSGLYSMEEMVALAKEMGLEVLVMADHDLVAMEYGYFPFKNLMKKRVEKNSVIKFGPEKYLSMISQVNQRQKDVLVIPGVQSAPFYYWTGRSPKKNLTANNYRKELLLIGMMSADDYRNLPLMHRGFSTRHVQELLSQSIVFVLSFFMGIYLVFQRGYLKAAGIIIALASAALLINHHPFQSSRFDAYHGDQGIAPYQDLIDYVNERGGLTFWVQPESGHSKSVTNLGPIKLTTASHDESLLEARNYTGFSAVGAEGLTLTDPGKMWDQLLSEYCSGRRSRPVWGIAGSNFHGEADGVRLNTFQTVFMTQSKSVLHIVDALAKGRVYAKLKEKDGGLKLSHFSVDDAGTGKSAEMGAELDLSSYPVIKVAVASDHPIQHAVKVLLVKDGSVLHQSEGRTPLEFVFEDRSPWVKKSYYRLEVQSPSAGRLFSNPVFVDRKNAFSDRKIETDSSAGRLAQSRRAESGETAAGFGDEGRKRRLPEIEFKITAASVPYSLQTASLPSVDLARKSLLGFTAAELPVYHVKVNLGDKGVWWRLYVGCFDTHQAALKARDSYRLPESIVQKTPYANRVGVYDSLEAAAAIRQQLEALDYSPYVVRKSAQSYHVYVGAFVTLTGATELQRELKKNGIAAEVVKR